MKVPNGMKVRFFKDECEGIIDELTELVVGLGHNSDSRPQYRITAGDPD